MLDHLDQLHHLPLLHAQLPVREGAVVRQDPVELRLRLTGVKSRPGGGGGPLGHLQPAGVGVFGSDALRARVGNVVFIVS